MSELSGNPTSATTNYGHPIEPNPIKCPRCKKDWLYERIPRSWGVKTFLFFMPLRRYKCYSCGRRPHVFVHKK